MSRPALIYGTAWKEDDTEALTRLAIDVGFRAIDTANQRKHYVEAAVGRAIQGCGLPRDELFLQTKFTFRAGQDHRLPYDPHAPIAEQVRQSFASSLEHLQLDPETGFIDSYVLHGPSSPYGWGDDDREAWRAMEALHAEGRVRALGVSNVSAEQLARCCDAARVLPTFVQNRCYAQLGWDAAVRSVCGEHGIHYQGFSLITANLRVLATKPTFGAIVARLGWTVPQVIFRAAIAMGIIPLTGTTNEAHMRDDLAVPGLELDPADLDRLERIAL